MKRSLFAAILVAAAASGCGGVASPSSNKQENFSLVVQPGGVSLPFNFSVSSGGSLEYSVFVSTVTPNPPSGIAIALGQNLSGQCGIVQPTITAIFGHTVLSGAIQPGSWCVVAYDPGSGSGITTFLATTTITGYVSHP